MVELVHDQRQRELYEELARVRAAATAPMGKRDFKAWAKVILIRHQIGQGVSAYALSCAREALESERGATPSVAGPFRPPIEIPRTTAALPAADEMPDEHLPPVEAYAE